MHKNEDGYIIVGKIGAPYGVKGWLKIFSISHRPENLMKYQQWYIKSSKDQWSKLEIAEKKRHDKHLIISIAGINDVDSATAYTNKEIAIKLEQLPKLNKNEYYWADLEGLTVVTKEGIKLGTIDFLMETGSNDVIVVVGKKRRLIPFIREQVVLEIDLDKKIMVVNWDPEF